jgi:malate dehydrogenase (quinone)
LEDGTIETIKAVKISESFEVSRQFWTYLVEKGLLGNPESFIKSVPHMSFVWGEDNVEYLKKRFEALQQFHLFKAMQYSEDIDQINTWAPLVMENRNNKDKIAATTMKYGTDVNFGSLTRSMFQYLESLEGVTMHFHHDVYDLKKRNDGRWRIKVKNIESGEKKKIYTPFVFIGAGGGSLLLLEKANIHEGDGFGGFPVSGQWLKCTNPEVIKKHGAKVYGKASVGAPPMSVPHIDTRMIDGEKALLFGPYAGFSTKFLKNGSYFDLIKSIELSNIKPMLGAGIHNIPLTKYLIEQVFQSSNDRLKALKEYVPSAKKEDWVLENAGQRVQVIKKDAEGNGILEFGTEVVCAADGSLSVLLGASPGASTAVSIMIDLIKRCFPEEVKSEAWQEKFKEMIPSFGQSLNENTQLCDQIRSKTNEILKLKC